MHRRPAIVGVFCETRRDEPLETGTVTVARARRRVEFPARFQLVAAMNPCPCGYAGHPQQDCRCTPEQVARYRARLSGPLLDRVDLTVEVPSIGHEELAGGAAGEPSAAVRARLFLFFSSTDLM